MKRIKIMLLSMFVLATVGGVLAFKVKDDNFSIYQKIGTTCPRVTIAETVKTTTSPLVQPIFFTRAALASPLTVPVASCTLKITDVVED